MPAVRTDHGYHLMLRIRQRGALQDLDAAVVKFKTALASTEPTDQARGGQFAAAGPRA